LVEAGIHNDDTLEILYFPTAEEVRGAAGVEKEGQKQKPFGAR
jgi:hypothetical protein